MHFCELAKDRLILYVCSARQKAWPILSRLCQFSFLETPRSGLGMFHSKQNISRVGASTREMDGCDRYRLQEATTR